MLPLFSPSAVTAHGTVTQHNVLSQKILPNTPAKVSIVTYPWNFLVLAVWHCIHTKARIVLTSLVSKNTRWYHRASCSLLVTLHRHPKFVPFGKRLFWLWERMADGIGAVSLGIVGIYREWFGAACQNGFARNPFLDVDHVSESVCSKSQSADGREHYSLCKCGVRIGGIKYVHE